MKFSAAFAATVLSAVVCAAPGGHAIKRQQTDRGNETIAGLGARKQEVTAAGASTLDLAIAMLETTNMGTDYAYGDNKVEDASNFGIFKQNWGMLRECSAQFKGQTTADWNNGAALNSDLGADITARHECESFYGQDTWFSGHRNGESGLQNPDTPDIRAYKEGVFWIQSQIESDPKYLTDDTRFWADIVPI
ncbi:hypothetical protein AJ79_09785 [Helicocarpus griseus UAMH5409]|uniref:Uncharacterized protein n=1 Tax=Helicocarpus griseus UAMH5409 TaxID=1447875 RepID=A0A2B7WGU6_9EURO|nr:hypothetical protein AJ79_09785 [Helicocarpus griseus UAMH5409]